MLIVVENSGVFLIISEDLKVLDFERYSLKEFRAIIDKREEFDENLKEKYLELIEKLLKKEKHQILLPFAEEALKINQEYSLKIQKLSQEFSELKRIFLTSPVNKNKI